MSERRYCAVAAPFSGLSCVCEPGHKGNHVNRRGWGWVDSDAEQEIPPVFPPVRSVAVCPECCGELQHEGVDTYWCSACRKEWFFTQVELHEDEDRDD